MKIFKSVIAHKSPVIPAKAGIQAFDHFQKNVGNLDPRLRGDDGKKHLNPLLLSVLYFLFIIGCAPSAQSGQAKNNDKEKTMTVEKDGLKVDLTPLQFEVTQKCGTEPPFKNEYWDNHREGIYVDIVSGEALFSSTDKFESGTGWPSFTKPIEKENVVDKTDKTYGMIRTEVKSKKADSHLGHVFPDGPGPNGLRYCINSASLKFISVEDLEKEGYGKYKSLFKPE